MANNKEVNKPLESNSIASFVTETDIPKYLVDSYYQYISYITAGRVCCNYMDGFLNIHRRVLYAANKVCKTHYVKANTLNSHVSGHYSPHGESPSATISLISNGFIDIIGSNENNMGVEYAGAAAPRYIEVKLHPISEILFLNNELLPYVNYIETELSTTENIIFEPTFLPVLLPGIYVSIADSSEFESYMEKGIKVQYPRYAVLSLLDYVIKYLQTGEFDKSLVYYQYHNMIKKCNDDNKVRFEEEFKCPIEIDDENNAHIVAKPPFAKMETMLKNIPYMDLTSMHTDIMFPKKYISSKMKSNPKFNVLAYKLVDNDYENVVLKPYTLRNSIITIIDNFKNIIFPRYFKDKIEKVQNDINEYELLKIVRHKYVDEHIPYDQMNNEEQKMANKYRVSTFMTIEDKLDSLYKLLNSYKLRAKNIDNEIISLYLDAKTKITKLMQTYWNEQEIKLYDVTNL